MLVLEIASLKPTRGSNLAVTDGPLTDEMLSSAEADESYPLLIRWKALSDHTELFLVSPTFAKFKDILWPRFSTDPAVHHFIVD